MLFSGKKNVFMCLVAFQKIFSDVWLCSWKYHRKHILYLLLTFSHIFSVAKRIYNIIHSSKHKKKTQKKKNHQIWTLREIAISAKARSRSARSVLRAKHRSRSKLHAIGAMLVMLADNIGKLGFGRSLLSLLSFSLSLSLSLSYFPRLEIIWSENGNRNDFLLFWLSFSVNWKCFSVWPNLK